MTVATFTQPNFTTQLGNSYKGNIDGGLSVFARIAGAFAPHEQSTPNMTVRLDAGYVFSGSVLTEVAAQSSAAMVAPTTNPRIDRIVVDVFTGVASVVTGVQGASPVAPAIPTGKMPVAQVLLQTTSTVITNSMLTDERLSDRAVAMAGVANGVASLDASGKQPFAQLMAPVYTYTQAADNTGNVTLTGLDGNAWGKVRIEISSGIPTAAATDLGIRFNGDAAANYKSSVQQIRSDTTAWASFNAGVQDKITVPFAALGAAYHRLNAVIDLAAGKRRFLTFDSAHSSSSVYSYLTGGGAWSNTTDNITQMDLILTSGVATGGTFPAGSTVRIFRLP